ncbi:F-box domain [Macleaya cordata]|uniref:F-box domain n=1 Tax=Macleaya cordata TaxID=56857 RepID=A0A200QSY3_MACCD|nr:F-box domain [Macleaya cordata]
MSSSDLEHEFFPEEVVLQILARLPIKSLFRCKSVCKLWNGLPSNKYFIQLYNEISSKNPMILVEVIKSFYVKSSYICVDRLRGVSEFSLDFLKDRVKVRASCNGLLCCASIPSKGVYYVCNPMTREFKLLPRTRERPMTRFHPDDEATLVGLAVDLSTQKYNVVLAGFYRPFGRRPLDSFICLVFDSETNTWKRSITSLTEEFTHMNRNQVVFVSGCLHWLTYSCLYILVLNLENEVWSKILLPKEVVDGSGNRIHLLKLDGLLSVIQISEAWMTIWALKDYKSEEWYVLDKVSLRCIKGLVPSVFPISQTSEYMLLATQKQILVYHRRSRLWKEMYSVKNSSTYPLWFSAHAFKSTIFSCHDGVSYS